ncbi:MAG TPA: glycoside hydrolase family 13 protein [Chloroflexota bacterium]|nr:glycoside hydrolase family 13 protein [Chloroflexota bacterium]
MPRLHIRPDDIFHLPRAGDVYPLDGQTLRVRLRARRGLLDECLVQWGDRYAARAQDQQQPMEIWAQDSAYDYWHAAITQPTRRVHYLFRVGDGRVQYWFGEEGVSLAEPGTFMTAGYFHYPFIHESEVFDSPHWAREAIVYQIFVDRFRNGDPSNDPPGTVPWGTPPTGSMVAGGDLQGILDKLGYLADLGVTALYLTPIFLAGTNHKYDTVDYRRIDPSFGDEQTLRKLLDAAHARGMSVILDAVFNHAGKGFAPWQDVVKHQEQSRYRDWFHIHAFPVDPDAPDGAATFDHFGNHPSLPKLNTQNEEVSAYLFETAEHWTRLGIDGWRLDAANEVDHAFWRTLHSRLRAINRECALIGEIWHEATQFVHTGEFDGLTHFAFWGACRAFIAMGTMDAAGFNDRLTRARVPYQEQAVLWNVLGTHDTPRFFTDCQEDPRRMRAAFALQMTYPGVPHIYYGDEIGMPGENDPGDRACMIWEPNAQQTALRAYVRRLVALRRAHPALLHGSCTILAAAPRSRLYAYLRRQDDDSIMVAVNAGRRPITVSIAAERVGSIVDWQSALDDARYTVSQGLLTVPLPAYGSVVLCPA